MRQSTRSIIVTSGTLSPLSSYQSELDIDFKITLEANHVIPANRVWIGSIAQGPRNTLLNGTFKTTGTFDYQVRLPPHHLLFDLVRIYLFGFFARMSWAAWCWRFARRCLTVSFAFCRPTRSWISSTNGGRAPAYGNTCPQSRRWCASLAIRALLKKRSETFIKPFRIVKGAYFFLFRTTLGHLY